MKKMINFLIAMIFTIITPTSIIACANPFLDDNILRIAVITDGHTITDNSFNESAYTGALKFQAEFNQWVKNSDSSAPDDLRKKRVVVTPIMPVSVEINNLLQSYGQAIVMNSEVSVVTGFVQDSALVNAQNGSLKNKMRYIFVDGDTPNSVVPYENKNLAGLQYQAEQSGFLAGIAAGIWLIANAVDYGGYDDLKMSTYGGVEIEVVVNYMYGFYWAIDFLNNITDYNSDFNETLISWVKILNPNFDRTSLPKIHFVSLSDQFTHNFNQSSREAKVINSILVSEKTDVIFPVAGPQVADTLAAIERTNSKIVGVDTDQQLQYQESANRFITSALKNITGSVNYMLWRAINYDETEEHNQLAPGKQDEIFKEDAFPRGGKEFTGIADNKLISSIYNNIIDNEKFIEVGGVLDQISQSWKTVLEHKNDLWNYGKAVNPFKLNFQGVSNGN